MKSVESLNVQVQLLKGICPLSEIGASVNSTQSAKSELCHYLLNGIEKSYAWPKILSPLLQGAHGPPEPLEVKKNPLFAHACGGQRTVLNVIPHSCLPFPQDTVSRWLVVNLGGDAVWPVSLRDAA